MDGTHVFLTSDMCRLSLNTELDPVSVAKEIVSFRSRVLKNEKIICITPLGQNTFLIVFEVVSYND